MKYFTFYKKLVRGKFNELVLSLIKLCHFTVGIIELFVPSVV